MDEVLARDGVGQAEAIRAGEVTSADLVEAALARVDERNPELNAVIHRFDDRARRQATTTTVGPFGGVPFLVKDAVCHTAGDPYHFGMRFLKERNWTEDHDTWLAGRFRAAGFVFVGKTNTPELASTVTTEPVAYGPSHNPWDPTRSTGGSSGGAAAAVASGMVAVAHANDMGGSIRNPASQCGLVGLKPTRGRTTLGPDLGDLWGPLTHEGVITRSVRDTAAVLDAVAGNAPGDPYLAPPLPRPLRDEVGADPGRLRIGFSTTLPGTGRDAHPECVHAVQSTAALLDELGHDVEAGAPGRLDDFDVTTGPLGLTVCVAIAREVERWSARTGDPIGSDDLEPSNAMLAEVGRTIDGATWLALQQELHRLARDLLAWWRPGADPGTGGPAAAGFDLLVLPTIGILPPELGRAGPDADPAEALEVLTEITAPLAPWNITGQPAVSLPLHWSAEGLPVGVQLVAATGREDVLVRVASQLEAARPWADRQAQMMA
jgi:amidase